MHAEPDEAPARRSTRRGRRWLPWLPVIGCALIVIVLGFAKVSGSSAAVYGLGNRPDAGQVRPIRTDEYLQRTPLVMRQAQLDFPTTMQVGMGTHSTAVLSDLPVKAWTALLRPQTLPYFVFDVERAFAFEWWLVLTAPFLGVYAVVLSLTRRVGLASFTGAAVALSPAALWWAIPSMGMSIGWSSACAAALLAAGRARRRPAAIAFALAAGYAMAALTLLLYIPWILPLTLVFASVVIGSWLGRDIRPTKATLLTILGVAGGTALVLVTAFVLRERDAISAIMGSAYPGARRNPAGEGSLATLFSAPFDTFAGATPLATVNGTNQSDTAVGLMLWIPVLLAEGTLWGWRRSADQVRRVLALLMIVLLALLAWCVLPVPSWVGGILKFDLVLSTRMYLPLTVGGLLLIALFVHVRQTERGAGIDVAAGKADRFRMAAGVLAALTAWAGLALRVNSLAISRTWITVLALLVAVIAYLVLTGRTTAAMVSVLALTSFSSLRINPVQVGMQPLVAAPLIEQIDAVRALQPDRDGTWLLAGTDINGYGPLAASGVPLTSGLSLYADQNAWAVLDLEDDDEPSWNRFGRVEFGIFPDATETRISTPVADVITVEIGACRPELAELGVAYVVTHERIDSPCLTQILPDPTTTDRFWVYELVPL